MVAKPYNPKIFRYTVIQTEEDPLNCTILKEGITADFTIKEVRDNIIELEKKKTEIEAATKIEEAKIVNILRDMPEIEKIDENLMKVYYIYQKSKSFVAGAREKLAEIDDATAEMRADLQEITEQTGLNLDSVFTNVEIKKVDKQEENTTNENTSENH